MEGKLRLDHKNPLLQKLVTILLECARQVIALLTEIH